METENKENGVIICDKRSRVEDFINREIVNDDDINIKQVAFEILARALIGRAENAGYVITIDLIHKEPLAMGNYEMVPTVRKNFIR